MLTKKQMQEGVTLHIQHYRDKAEGVTGKVVAVRDIHENSIDARTHIRDVMTRSRFLVTLEFDSELPEGGKHRSYYHAFVEAKLLEARSV